MIKIFKFGGTSIKDAANIKRVAEILRIYSEDKLVIVFSAMGKVTNMLEEVTEAYVQKNEQAESKLQLVKDFHTHLLGELFEVNNSIYNDLTVEHNIRVSLPDYINQNDIKSEGQKILNRLGLQVKLSDRAGSLSHGHKQWLSIGMALAMEPKLLLLDEPTAGMGSEETILTAELVKSLNSEGVTILVIEHDMAFVRELKAPITVLHLGKILAEGTLKDIEKNSNVRNAYLGNN